MDARRIGGFCLLGAALFGAGAAPLAPRRFGRRGGLAVTGGVAVLAARDVAMVASGAPARLRRMPRVLLYAEVAVATAAAALGALAWLRPARRDESAASAGGFMADGASGLAALTFAVHSARQAIYLTPGRGRRPG